MNRFLLSAATISVVCGVMSAGAAEAQTGRRHVARIEHSRPLTVTGRSWLDSGNVVPVGTGQSYISDNTTLNLPTYTSYAPDRFGQATLPGRFDLPFAANPRGPAAGGGIFFDD